MKGLKTFFAGLLGWIAIAVIAGILGFKNIPHYMGYYFLFTLPVCLYISAEIFKNKSWKAISIIVVILASILQYVSYNQDLEDDCRKKYSLENYGTSNYSSLNTDDFIEVFTNGQCN